MSAAVCRVASWVVGGAVPAHFVRKSPKPTRVCVVAVVLRFLSVTLAGCGWPVQLLVPASGLCGSGFRVARGVWFLLVGCSFWGSWVAVPWLGCGCFEDALDGSCARLLWPGWGGCACVFPWVPGASGVCLCGFLCLGVFVFGGGPGRLVWPGGPCGFAVHRDS